MSNILFIDTETTGLIPGHHSIIELAAIYYMDGVEYSRFHVQCAPSLDSFTSLGAVAVNKVSPIVYMSRKSPVTACNEFIDYVLNLPGWDKYRKIVLAGHNVQFDVNHLKAMFAKNRIENFDGLFDYHMIDTFPVAMFLKDCGIIQTDKLSLGPLSKSLGIEVNEKNLHGAVYDAHLAAKVYYKMTDIVKGEDEFPRKLAFQ